MFILTRLRIVCAACGRVWSGFGEGVCSRWLCDGCVCVFVLGVLLVGQFGAGLCRECAAGGCVMGVCVCVGIGCAACGTVWSGFGEGVCSRWLCDGCMCVSALCGCEWRELNDCWLQNYYFFFKGI